MRTRTVVLTDDEEALVRSVIANGRYEDAGDVLWASERAPGSGGETVQSAFAEARWRRGLS